VRILYIGPRCPPSGGIGTNTERILRWWAANQNVTVHVVDTAVRWRSEVRTSTVVRLIGGSCHAFQKIAQAAYAAVTFAPDVALVATSGSYGFARDLLTIVFLRLGGVPSVVRLHFGRVPTILSNGGLEAALLRAVVSACQGVLVLDEATAESIRQNFPHRDVWKIPNFVERAAMESMRRAPQPHCDVMYVGHVIPAKGVLDLAHACSAFPGLRVRMVGAVAPDMREELMAIARQGGFSLEMPGTLTVTAVYEALAGARALVLPSYTEGFPNAVLEAMALGCPVIATPVGAVPEMLQFGSVRECGCRVNVGSIDDLRAAIGALLIDNEKWEAMGALGRDRAFSEYADDVVMVRITEALAQVTV
jgi:glycosyltransferase involved in cell wall biosynthesis